MIFTREVFLALLCSVVFTSGGQLLQKQASLKYASIKSSSIFRRLLSIEFVGSTAFLGLGLLFWMIVLTKIELSLAYPLLSINYVLILLGARYLFKEKIPLQRWFGVFVILVGIGILLRGAI